MIKEIRNPRLTFYTNESIDRKCDFIQNYTSSRVPILTTDDGNCLHYAISIVLYGNESKMQTIKLCVVFIMLEYEDLFKQILEAEGNEITTKSLIETNAELGVWSTQYTLIALNILTARPIYSYSSYANNSISTNIFPTATAKPIGIAFNKDHFFSILPINNKATLAQPSAKANTFWKFTLDYVDY